MRVELSACWSLDEGETWADLVGYIDSAVAAGLGDSVLESRTDDEVGGCITIVMSQSSVAID